MHSSGVAKSSTSFGRGKGWNVTSAGWQVTLCDPIWHVSSSSGESCCELLYPVTTLLYFLQSRLRQLSLCAGDTVKLRSKRRCTLGLLAADNELVFDDKVRISRVMRSNLRAKNGDMIRYNYTDECS